MDDDDLNDFLLEREHRITHLNQLVRSLTEENTKFKQILLMNNLEINQLKSNVAEERNLKEDYQAILKNQEDRNQHLQNDIVGTVGKLQQQIDLYEDIIARTPSEIGITPIGYDRLQKYTKEQVVCMSNRMNRVPDYFKPTSSERKRTKAWKKRRVAATEATMKGMKKHLLGNLYDSDEDGEQYDGTCSRTRPHYNHHPYFKF